MFSIRIILVAELLACFFVVSCSSGNGITLSDGNPSLPGEGHAILTAGTLMIDTAKNEVRSVKVDPDPFITSFDDLLGRHFKVSIVDFTSPTLNLKMEIMNPSTLAMFDMRVIIVDSHGKMFTNPDGYTNFYETDWSPGFKPFIYFAKDRPNQAFPVGPGGSDDEILQFSWPPGAEAYLSYIVECSIKRNTGEPYKIHDIKMDGEITRVGGGAIVSCTIEDWQDDIESVSISAGDFQLDNAPMYRFQGSNTFMGNILNFYSLVPGTYTGWIKAQSPNKENLALEMPFTVNISATGSNAPAFRINPEGTPISLNEKTNQLRFHLIADMYNGISLDYLWEQNSPSLPQGEFGHTGQNRHDVEWVSPLAASPGEYLFKLRVSNPRTSHNIYAIVPLSTEMEKPAVISKLTCQPNPVNEGQWVQVDYEFYDPDRPNDNSRLDYWMNPGGHWNDEFRSTNRQFWKAPEVDQDETFQVGITVQKDWGDIGPSTDRWVDVLVKNVD